MITNFKLFEIASIVEPIAENLLDQIETFMQTELSKSIFYEIINFGKIIPGELKSILSKISNINKCKEETVFIKLLKSIYPEIRESREFKDIYWDNITIWHNKYKNNNEFNSQEFKDKLENLESIIKQKSVNLRDLILNGEEWASDYDTRLYADKYNL
jgi:hypothetical protein